jgi:hypothetical protein
MHAEDVGRLSFERWLKQPKERCARHPSFRAGRSKKICEQMGDIFQWNQSNKNYILTHGVSGVDRRFYKHSLPEHVFDLSMQYWVDVRLACEDAHTAQ